MTQTFEGGGSTARVNSSEEIDQKMTEASEWLMQAFGTPRSNQVSSSVRREGWAARTHVPWHDGLLADGFGGFGGFGSFGVSTTPTYTTRLPDGGAQFVVPS